MKEARVAGGLFVVLGAIAVVEARRLIGLREEMIAGATVGDDTFPLVIGVAFFLAGVYSIFVAKWQAVPVSFPRGTEGRQILLSLGVLVAYTAITPQLGYTASTLLAGALLFRVMGGYRWLVCLLISGAVAGALYLMFRVWLLEPLPTGWVGF